MDKEWELRTKAKYAIEKLTEYRTDYRQGKISHELLKVLSVPLIADFDKYTKAKAKKFNLKAKKFSLSSFLR